MPVEQRQKPSVNGGGRGSGQLLVEDALSESREVVGALLREAEGASRLHQFSHNSVTAGDFGCRGGKGGSGRPSDHHRQRGPPPVRKPTPARGSPTPLLRPPGVGVRLFSPAIRTPGRAAVCRSVSASAILSPAVARRDRWPTWPRSAFTRSRSASPGIPAPPLIGMPKALAVSTIPSPGPNEYAIFRNSRMSPAIPAHVP